MTSVSCDFETRPIRVAYTCPSSTAASSAPSAPLRRAGLRVPVEIDLRDLQASVVLLRELFEQRRERLARATPFAPEVDEDGCRRLQDIGGEGVSVMAKTCCIHGLFGDWFKRRVTPRPLSGVIRRCARGTARVARASASSPARPGPDRSFSRALPPHATHPFAHARTRRRRACHAAAPRPCGDAL